MLSWSKIRTINYVNAGDSSGEILPGLSLLAIITF